MPDFDIDFCETHRDEVIAYVQGKYGRDRVAQIITFGRLKARAVLKDTGRVLQMSYGQVDRLAKLIPNHPTDPWDLKRALERRHRACRRISRRRRRQAPVRPGDEARRPAAPRLDPRRGRGHRRPPAGRAGPALPRSALGHAGHPVRHEICRGGGAGEVRLPRPQDAVGAQARRSDCSPRKASTSISTRSPGTIRQVYELLQRGDTVGVFQLESEGMRRTLAGGPPDRFRRHHRARLALPAGPDGQHSAVRRPQERPRVEIAYPHPMLEEVLAETYGIFVYQEQVMQAAQGARRLHPRRRRPAAPRDGQEDPSRRWTPSAPASSTAAGGQRHPGAPRPTSCST